MTSIDELFAKHKADNQPIDLHRYAGFLESLGEMPTEVILMPKDVPSEEINGQVLVEPEEVIALPKDDSSEEIDEPDVVQEIKEESEAGFVCDWSKYTPDQKALFDSLEPGDVIVAWMPLSKEKMKRVKENHQKRPYVVVAKKKGHVRAYPCTSQAKYTDPASRYELGRLKYKMWKCGYIQIQSPVNLSINHLVNKIDRLVDEDIVAINRIAAKRSIKEIERKYSFNVESGDIVRDRNKLYYVFVKDHEIVYYPLNKQGKKGSFMLKTSIGDLYPELKPTNLSGVIDKSCVTYHCQARVRRLMESRI